MRTYVCICGGKTKFSAGGKYEKVIIECLKCKRKIEFTKEGVERLG